MKFKKGFLLSAFAITFFALATPSVEARIPNHAWREPIPQEISTPHPYWNNMSETWTINHPGARYLRLNFSRFETERRFDRLIILDQNNREVENLSGSYPEGVTVELEGDTAHLHFTTDGSVVNYGFDLINYQVSAWPH